MDTLERQGFFLLGDNMVVIEGTSEIESFNEMKAEVIFQINTNPYLVDKFDDFRNMDDRALYFKFFSEVRMLLIDNGYCLRDTDRRKIHMNFGMHRYTESIPLHYDGGDHKFAFIVMHTEEKGGQWPSVQFFGDNKWASDLNEGDMVIFDQSKSHALLLNSTNVDVIIFPVRKLRK